MDHQPRLSFLINRDYFGMFSSSGKMFCLILLLIIEAIGIESASVANFNTRDDISSRPNDLVLFILLTIFITSKGVIYFTTN